MMLPASRVRVRRTISASSICNYVWPGSTQEDVAVFVHTYVTSSASTYDDWSEHVMGPLHPQNGTRIFDQSWRVPVQVIDHFK